MLKLTVSVFLLIIALLVGRLIFLSLTSKVPDTTLDNGVLRPCPKTPNCISSEGQGNSNSIEPLHFDSSTDEAWQKLRGAIKRSGGSVLRDEKPFMWATYTSTIFRFVDDMEFRLAPEEKSIHVRSASRVGHSDLGVNRKNVEKLRKQFNKENTSEK